MKIILVYWNKEMNAIKIKLIFYISSIQYIVYTLDMKK